MSWTSADTIHRTAKILIDAGRASDPDEARRYLEGLVLQVAVGPELGRSHAAQAALATVVNAGHRAYLGGVRVYLADDPALSTGWTVGMTASEAVTRYGGTVVDHLSTEYPTLVIGRPTSPVGKPVLHLTWRGWVGGVVDSSDATLDDDAITPAGVIAAALGISETFQQQLGATVPGRRDVGVSLWCPDLDWRHTDAVGPALQFLPASLWLFGLGHLGQAYAWTIGMLPYAKPNDVELGLVDFDIVVEGNLATQMLVRKHDVDRRKTRVVAAAFKALGIRTRLVERAFDEHFHPVVHADPRRNEPTIALAGFDKAEPRRQLGNAGLSLIVDAGLGAGPIEYLDIVLHTFPATEGPATAFAEQPPSTRALPRPYEDEIARWASTGVGETSARCGMLDIAGVTVGAAFVGAFTSTLVVADILRVLHDGQSYSVVTVDLRHPAGIQAITNAFPRRSSTTAFTLAE